MKYLILVADGAGDEPIKELGGKTPLETANIKNINQLAKKGTVGVVSTVPEGIAPGSDAANLSVMGYDPRVYLTGRSPLEAASIGIDMSDTDVAFRCNIVTLQGEGAYEDLTVLDHSAGDITTEEADELIKAVNEKFGNELIQFYTGVSYRHCMIVKNGETDYVLTPPHDILTKKVREYMPKGEGADFIYNMMKESYELLSKHPVNIRRVEKGLNPANSIWIWGQGKKPQLSSFYDKYQIKGATISAVDLIKGIGICAGLKSVDVEGATGTIHTNFSGKAEAAIQQFKDGMDFIYLHVEAPDECSHQGDLSGKISSLELIDEKIVGPVIEYLRSTGEAFRFLVLPDHQTPISIRTHAGKPVPFVLYDSSKETEADESKGFNETAAAASGLFFGNGYELTDYFFGC
ncbi:cofactor-independent phosphoglycerate mutase [Sinanaerobacter sp. ZZT-01]|uniref:cofactor-independent phosphoglycerate mutase n=1 Tax=Sinanaerobacter sp. ZZT-01 TaxID=3111540 RepID=UPI002D77C2D6|nr:cofactor-independent phosphoglycerate mutase [Sinanaerobacter sp. ZZT-01]WRR92328.1 cofactor-independent phosphoglycerate mutase [Sinanaerobacter sp. ZZT-01]